MARGRLKKGDISIKEMYQLSHEAYKFREVDNKISRMILDIIGAKLTIQNNLQYNRSTKKWDQIGREVKLAFLIKSDPQSYVKKDTVKIHNYPIYFLLRDINMGMDSAFKWRAGSFKKPKFPSKSMSVFQKLNITNYNIRSGIQLQFFFELMQVLDMYGLLYGPNTTNKQLPRKANPKLIPFFDKHSLFITKKIVIPLLKTGKLKKLA
jgi:hypothetical protein